MCYLFVKDNIPLMIMMMMMIATVGNSLVVQWLGLCTLTAKDRGSIPGPGTNFPQATRHDQNKTKIATIIEILLFTEHTLIYKGQKFFDLRFSRFLNILPCCYYSEYGGCQH